MKFVTPPERPTLNILLYGPGKTGKSLGAASAPGNIVYGNFDLGNATRTVHARNRGRILEPEIPPYEQNKHPIFDLMTEISTMVMDPERCPDAVVIDPVGELHRRLLEETSNRAVRPVIQAYGDASTYVERFCRHLCEAPVTVVFVAHDHPVKDEGDGSVERLPWTGTTNPALGNKLIGMVDIVGYTGVVPPQEEGQREQYVAQLRAMKGRRGGDRFNVLAPVELVNIAEWVDRIKAAEAEEPAKQAAPAEETIEAKPEEAKAA